MRRMLVVFAISLGLCASARAGTLTYAAYSSWPAGQAASTGYSSGWFQTIFYKTAAFDTTLTFIDNVSYSWHSTVRSSAPYVETHWLSSKTKKAHCRANSSGPYGACTAYS